jgi:Zn-finger nucleic acid-binding protein
MEREGKEHIYTITTGGLRSLASHETDIAGASIDRLGSMDLPRETLVKLLNKLKQNVRMTWCPQCGGNNIDWGGVAPVLGGAEGEEEEIEICMDCFNANLAYGTLSEYETFLKEKGLFNEKGFIFKLD